MNQNRINYRILENVRRVTLDQNDKICAIKKEIKEVKSYFSFKMLMFYFGFILAQAITVSFYIAKQQSKIEQLEMKIKK